MPASGIHTFNQSCWHYCARCGSKADLNSELQWQYSKLLCHDCYDQYPVIVGAIEQKQAEALAFIIQNPDLRPHQKLVNPLVQDTVDDILL